MIFRWSAQQKRISLRSQMLFGSILILLIPLIIVGTVTFINSSRSLEDISKLQLVQTARSISGMIRINLEKDLRILTGIANDPLMMEETVSERYELITKKISSLINMLSGDYEDFAVFDSKGVIRADGFDKNRIGIDISDRDYFAAAAQGRISVGTMVYSKATGFPIFVLCAPIVNQDQFIGGVIGVVKADYLMKYLSSIKMGETGYAFMLDRNGVIIAHPDRSLILNFDLTSSPHFIKTTRKMLSGRTGTEEYVYQGVKKVAGFTPVDLAGWSIAVTQNKDEIMTLAYANRNFILGLSTFFIFSTIIAVYFFSRSVSTPVQEELSALNHAVEQAEEAFVIVGLDKKVQYANPAMASIVGESIKDIVGKPLAINEENGVSEEQIWKALQGGESWSGFFSGVRNGGDKYTMDLTITPVYYETGKVQCYLAIGRDISGELVLREQMQQSQKMEAIGVLAGGIAHDFNNILSAVFGYAELSLAFLDNREKVDHYLKEILKASRRARDLVQSILTFSRKAESDQKPLIPKYIIKEALKLMRASLPSTIEIRENLNSSAAILGDATQMHQITMNLCTNSGYAMKEGGGVLEVSLDEIDLDENFAKLHPNMVQGRYLRLRVKDTGVGIPADVQERIFEPFYTTKPQGEGTGLGLSAVHGIVMSLKGAVTVSSEEGEGSEFMVYLPITQSEMQKMDDGERGEIPGGSERILLVDDETAIINSTRELLGELGYNVRSFTDSARAWEAFSSSPDMFDIIITDYTMPKMTGIELSKKIRSVSPDIPILICSGYLSFQQDLLALGSIDFLKKPVQAIDLGRTIRSILDQRREPGALEA